MTTYFLIKHEYKVDYHKERMSVLPVFSFIHICDKNKYIDEKGKWNADSYPLEMLENTAQNDTISYMDLYGNKYTQRFKMDKSADRYNITTFPLELTFRTKLMRYQQ